MNEKAKAKLKEIARNANRTLKTQASEGTKGTGKTETKGADNMKTEQINNMVDTGNRPIYSSVEEMKKAVREARKRREIRGSDPFGYYTVVGKKGKLSTEGRGMVKKLSEIIVNMEA